jgi:hypothetical protein
VDLRITGIRHVGSAFVRTERSHHVAPHRGGREEKNVTIPTSGQKDAVSSVTGDFTGLQVTCYDALRMTVNDYEVQHFGPFVHRNTTLRDLFLKRLVGTDEQLLPSLTASVKSPTNLGTTKGTVV